MGKKEYPDFQALFRGEDDFDFKPKSSGFGQIIFGIIKFILGIFLLPFVYGVSVSFLNEFSQIDLAYQRNFWAGLISLIVIYLFVWEPAIIYAKGQRLLELVFSFVKPLVKVAPYLLPIYTIVIFIIYEISSFIYKDITVYFMFMFGFSIALHLIFSAKTLRGRKQDALKGNYIFGFSFVYIVNLMLLAFFLNMVFSKFSFVNFCNYAFQIAGGVFKIVFKQLFVPS